MFEAGGVVDRIHRELGIALLTKHDSVLINPQYVDPVKKIFHEQFAALGLTAQLSVEKLLPRRALHTGNYR